MPWPRSAASSSPRQSSTRESPISQPNTRGRSPTRPPIPTNYKLFQQDVLEYMITYQLASQKAKELKITVTDAEVQTQIDSIKTSSFGGDQTQFDAALKQQGITLDQLKQSYKESMLLQKVYDEVTKNVTTVPDADIQAYYNAHKTDYFVDETRTARHILIAPVAGRVDGTTSTTTHQFHYVDHGGIDDRLVGHRRPPRATPRPPRHRRRRPPPPPPRRPIGTPLSRRPRRYGPIWSPAPTGRSRPRRIPTTPVPTRKAATSVSSPRARWCRSSRPRCSRSS